MLETSPFGMKCQVAMRQLINELYEERGDVNESTAHIIIQGCLLEVFRGMSAASFIQIRAYDKGKAHAYFETFQECTDRYIDNLYHDMNALIDSTPQDLEDIIKVSKEKEKEDVHQYARNH